MEPASEEYGRAARSFHWLTVVIVFLMIPAGVIMVREGIPRPLQNTLFLFHKNTGVVLFFIVLARLIYRWRHPAPPLPDTIPHLQRRIAAINHAAIYVLLLAMPVLGYVRVRAGRFPIEGLDAIGVPGLVPQSKALENAAINLHYAGALVLIFLIAVHVGAALYHGVILRDGVFQRMWPARR